MKHGFEVIPWWIRDLIRRARFGLELQFWRWRVRKAQRLIDEQIARQNRTAG